MERYAWRVTETRAASDGPLAEAVFDAADGSDPAGGWARDRLASFRVVYAAIFAFVVVSVVTVLAAEKLLANEFRSQVNQAIRVSPANGPVGPQIQERVRHVIYDSGWVRIGGVELNAIVIGADGTIIYSGGGVTAQPTTFDPIAVFRDAQRLLPAGAETFVALPINSLLAVSILVGYGSLLITGLFLHARTIARREAEVLRGAIAARDATAARAGSIERELEQVRLRLGELEPTERAHSEEIQELQRERGSLQRKLAELAEREQKLRSTAERSIELEEEHTALEELLEEALEDLGQKEAQIGTLETQLKHAAKAAPTGGRSRATEHLARRMRTLYKNLEFDDRAISDLVALRDETMRLKAEDGVKRLSDDSDNTAIRRKVGGLPPHLSIFEMGFAGKGRIYYTRGSNQRFRILAVGAKNTQKTDLEYLSRLSS
jgi:hypothetical protein